MGYIGREPGGGLIFGSSGASTIAGTINGSNRDFTLPASVDNAQQVMLFVDGVHQSTNKFTITNAPSATLNFNSGNAPATGSEVACVIIQDSFSFATVNDDAITLAKMASGTDGNIISYDASGNPVAIATGNDGQVLTSAGAGQPPAFEAVSGGKVLQIVHTSNATEATTNSTSYGNTAHTVTITPAGAGSVILVGVSFSAGVERDAITEASGYYKLCNTTDSADLVEAVYQVNGAEGDLGMFSFQTLIGVDTGRAGATEYYLQYKSANASATTYVNNSNDPGQMWAIEFSS